MALFLPINCASDKAKPVARRGRKTTGLLTEEKTAGLPGQGSRAFLFLPNMACGHGKLYGAILVALFPNNGRRRGTANRHSANPLGG